MEGDWEDVEAVSDGYSRRLEVRVPPGLIEQNIQPTDLQPTDPNFQARCESVERGEADRWRGWFDYDLEYYGWSVMRLIKQKI